ncbi:MAG: hypothetical protein GXZ05_00700 [Gammaproteobacteria bacterium]|nr:hypothetical protein [Gammaproteobacteria bacterium]
MSIVKNTQKRDGKVSVLWLSSLFRSPKKIEFTDLVLATFTEIPFSVFRV